jgi:hypothetical protein
LIATPSPKICGRLRLGPRSPERHPPEPWPPLPPPPDDLLDPGPQLDEPPTAPPELPAPEAGALVAVPADDEEHAGVLRNGSWGCFRMTAKQPGGFGGRFGGYQARCPFHRKNDKTDCKRFLMLRDDSRAERLLTLRRLIWWCSIAPFCDRQRDHLVQALPYESVPSYDHLRATIITEKPTRAQTDQELDAIDGIAAHRVAGPCGVSKLWFVCRSAGVPSKPRTVRICFGSQAAKRLD